MIGRKVAWGTGGVLALVLIMEAMAHTGSSRYLPVPDQIWSVALDRWNDSDFTSALSITVTSWLTAFAAAAVTGIAVGFLLGMWRPVRAFTASTVDFLRPIPSVAFIPIAVLMWGSDATATVVLAIYASFWLVVIQTSAGVAGVDPLTVDSAKTLRIGGLHRAVTVVAPQALPTIVTGLRLALSTSLVVVVSAEMLIGSPGLGHDIASARDGGAMDLMYFTIVVCGLLGLSADIIMRWLAGLVSSGRTRRLAEMSLGDARAGHSWWVRILLWFLLPMVVAILWWEWDSGSAFFPSLHQIIDSGREEWGHGHLLESLRASVGRYCAGMAITVVVGIAIGVAIGLTRRVADLLIPSLEFLRAIPAPVLVPVLIMMLGIGDSMRLSVLVVGSIWPIVLSTADGVRGIDPVAWQSVRVLRIGRIRRLWSFVLPAAAGRISAGIYQALGIGIVMLVVSEMFAAKTGIGADLTHFQNSFAIGPMWSGVLILGVFGVVVSSSYLWLEKRLLRWNRVNVS